MSRALLPLLTGALLLGACSAVPPRAAGSSPLPLASAGGVERQVGRRIGDEAYEFMRVAFEAGTRRYRDESWGRLDRQPAVGFTATHEPPHWLLGLDGGMFWAGGDDDLQGLADVNIDSWEGFAGVMKSLPLVRDRLLVELGAGYALSYVDLDEELLFDGDDAWWSAGYARASLLLRLGDEAWIGLAARSSRGGSANLSGAALEGDYDQLALMLAARW